MIIIWDNTIGTIATEHLGTGYSVDAGGTKCWFVQQQKDHQTAYRMTHREDGAAVEYADGTNHWYYHGKLIPVSNQKDFESWLRNKAFW